ncbi:MAG: hypothetical protein H6Q00_1265 [Holophagaceae bacterium]|nr:hypothetical protein [Holophagaceae bacterium]
MPVHLHVCTPGPLGETYLIARLARLWEAAGYQVSIGPGSLRDRDLGLLHIDRTRLSAGDLPENPAGVPLLNGRVMDISKDRYSELRVFPGDAWDGPVIVKGLLNAFGLPEWRGGHRGFFERMRRKLARRNWRLARRLPPSEYPVLPGVQSVPGWVWEDTGLMVERFLPEREGGLYAIRGWLFFGSRGYTYRLFSPSPVVKAGNMVKFDILGEPPPELESLRAKLGFDFGKFDYVMHEGRPVLLDANKTPTLSTGDSPRTRMLAEGLRDFLELP